MFKKFSLFLVLVLVIGALSACANSGNLTQTTLTEERKADIARAYLAYSLRIDLFPLGEHEGKIDIYLGTYDGTDLFLAGTRYYGYKDGQFSTVDEETMPHCKQILDGEVQLPLLADEARLNKIEEDWVNFWMARYTEIPSLQWSDNGGANHFYGRSSGYDILYVRGQMSMAVLSEIKIADQVFKSGYPFELLAYKDGVIYSLLDLYTEGEISEKTIQTVAKLHKERFLELYD